MLLAMEEILGRSGLEAILGLSRPTDPVVENSPKYLDQAYQYGHSGSLQIGLENEYGSIAGRGVALRVGQAWLKYGLREFGDELALGNLTFRLLPLQKRLKTGIEAFAALFNNYTNQRVRLEKDENNIYWQVEHCPLGTHSDDPCCQIAVGLLQEALYWVSGGKLFEVSEKQCVACGDQECIILINRTPVE